MRRTPALIVGGGPAGSSVAIMLARDGQRPMLLERSTRPHDVVCGGFLGWDALAALDRLGIDTARLGARPITHLHVAAGTQSAMIALPFEAAGLSRPMLDAALIAQAAALGARIERGVTVRQADPGTRCVLVAEGEAITPEALFLATGKYELRGIARPIGKLADPPVGIRVRLTATPALTRALDRRIELLLLDRGYAGLVLQEDGSANLCLSIAQSRLAAQGGDRDRLFAALARECPLFGERIGQASDIGGWTTIARVPYGWRAERTSAGLFRLGDQAAVIASLTGDGVAIALTSGIRAAEHYIGGGARAAVRYQAGFAREARRPLWIAERLRGWAERPGIAAVAVGLLGQVPFVARWAARGTRIGGY